MAAEEQAALSSIRKAATGLDATFQVGGTVKLQKELRVAWEDLSGTLKQLTFPATADGLDKLRKDCSPAVFGRGSEEVHDPEYRQALALPGHRFLTSFHPGSTSILADIERLTGYSRVHAEQDKLNLYEVGGFFKSHVDTPSDTDGHFGTLVACLPCKHTGGDLIIKHGDVAAQTDWTGKSDQDLIQWTAFYSDCIHEIRPVESGTRMTISYKLYASPLETLSPTLEPSSLALQQALSAALKEPSFPPEGRALGFVCSHRYPHSSTQFSRLMLKGPDAVIAAAAESLGLDLTIVPIWPGKNPQDRYHMFKEDSCSSQEEEVTMDPFLTGTPSMLRFKQDDLCEDEATQTKVLKNEGAYNAGHTQAFLDRTTAQLQEKRNTWRRQAGDWDFDSDDEVDKSNNQRAILWCHKLVGEELDAAFTEPGHSHPVYGNEPTARCVYSAAAIVIEVPPYAERQASSVTHPQDVAGRPSEAPESKVAEGGAHKRPREM